MRKKRIKKSKEYNINTQKLNIYIYRNYKTYSTFLLFLNKFKEEIFSHTQIYTKPVYIYIYIYILNLFSCIYTTESFLLLI